MFIDCPLRGIAQVNISANDVKKARDWYGNFLGGEPYFQRPDANNPAYVEFRVGDYAHELGIIDRNYLPEQTRTSPGGARLFAGMSTICQRPLRN